MAAPGGRARQPGPSPLISTDEGRLRGNWLRLPDAQWHEAMTRPRGLKSLCCVSYHHRTEILFWEIWDRAQEPVFLTGTTTLSSQPSGGRHRVGQEPGLWNGPARTTILVLLLPRYVTSDTLIYLQASVSIKWGNCLLQGPRRGDSLRKVLHNRAESTVVLPPNPTHGRQAPKGPSSQRMVSGHRNSEASLRNIINQ